MLNALFSAATCVGVYWFGRNTLGEPAARLGAWIFALLPCFMQWPCTLIWDTTLSGLLVISGLLLALHVAKTPSRRDWANFGAFWAIASLINPALATLTIVCGFWALAQSPRSATLRLWLAELQAPAYGAVMFFVLLAPWTARNYLVFHHPVFLRGNFGFEFRLGNFAGSNGMGWSGLHPALNPTQYAKYQELGEYEFVRQNSREAWSWVRQYPMDFIALSIKRVAYFWDGEPLRYWPRSPEGWNIHLFFLSSILGFAGLWHALRNRLHSAGLFLWILLVYPAPYYLVYAHPRYRYAIEPLIALLIGSIVAAAIARVDALRHSQ